MQRPCTNYGQKHSFLLSKITLVQRSASLQLQHNSLYRLWLSAVISQKFLAAQCYAVPAALGPRSQVLQQPAGPSLCVPSMLASLGCRTNLCHSMTQTTRFMNSVPMLTRFVHYVFGEGAEAGLCQLSQTKTEISDFL